MWVLVCLCLIWLGTVRGCHTVRVDSRVLGNRRFRQLPVDSGLLPLQTWDTGRPAYISDDGAHLYFDVDMNSATGRWIIAKDERILAYMQSWAVLPHLHESENSVARWRVIGENNKESNLSLAIDQSLSVGCSTPELDNTLFFDSSAHAASHLSGYFVQRQLTAESAYQGPVYSWIKFNPMDESRYLYIIGENGIVNDQGDAETVFVWLIGEQIGVDAGVAMTQHPSQEPTMLLHSRWYFATNNEMHPWALDESAGMWSLANQRPDFSASTSLAQVVRHKRAVIHHPDRVYYTLRNNVSLPAIGLGTGGIPWEQCTTVFRNAIEQGYQLFDMAREYRNEHLLGDVLYMAPKESHLFQRRNVFVESKVWPTEFDFVGTLQAVRDTLTDVRTNFVDLYLLHWSRCNEEIDWMHCETTRDAHATWRTSYSVLSKLYAEGWLNSIGVSNFEVSLLRELETEFAIGPHVVQNWAELGSLDGDVRRHCRDRGIIYQPYASVRNLVLWPPSLRAKSRRLARRYSVSEHSLSVRFFLQSGAAVIPRSTNAHHLEENIYVTQWAIGPQDMQELGIDSIQ